MIVLENVSAIATYAAVTTSRPSNSARPKPNGGRESDLHDPGGEGEGAGVADHAHVELEADDEEHERDAQLGQQVDLIVRPDDVEHRRSGQSGQCPGRDERDYQRLAQADGERTDHRRGKHQRGDLVKRAVEAH